MSSTLRFPKKFPAMNLRRCLSKVALMVSCLYTNLALATAPDFNIQRVEIYNSSLAVQDYIRYLYAGKVNGFSEAGISTGENLRVCGDGTITSEVLAEGEYPYDGAYSYLSFPICRNDGSANDPFASLITRCDMIRTRCGRYCHSIRANCKVVTAEPFKFIFSTR